MKKNCYYFLLIIFILLTVGNFCFARKVEVKLPGLTSEPNLLDYRNILFNFLIGLGGALAVLSLIIGAIQLMASAGNPELSGNAKKRIIGSVLGLILLFSSYLVMKTINPKIVSTIEIGALPLPPGIFLTDGKTESPCPMSISDISQLPAGFNKIMYKCAEGVTPEKQSILWVRKFKKTDLGDWLNGTVDEIKCGGSSDISEPDKSFMLDVKRPGLYLSSSGKDLSMQILNSQTEMDDLYKKNTKYFRIINNLSDSKNKIYYGVMFHTEIDFKGICDGAWDTKEDVAWPLDISPSSFEFFQWNVDNWKTSGDGVVFYSRPFGETVGASAARKEIKPSDIRAEIVISNPKFLEFDYSGVSGATEEEIKKCKTFFDCPGSIEIKGNYLVILGTLASGGEEWYCQSFYKYSNDAANLETSWFLKEVSGRKLERVDIIPLK